MNSSPQIHPTIFKHSKHPSDPLLANGCLARAECREIVKISIIYASGTPRQQKNLVNVLFSQRVLFEYSWRPNTVF